MKKFKKINYKGKWFTIQDEEVGPFDVKIGTITKEFALDPEFIKIHKKQCDYFGIPPVITDDKDLKKAYKKK